MRFFHMASAVLLFLCGAAQSFGQALEICPDESENGSASREASAASSPNKSGIAGSGYMDAPIVWSYVQDATSYTGISLGGMYTASAAVYIPAEEYAGDELRYIRVGFYGNVSDVTVFVRKELDSEDLCSVSVGSITVSSSDRFSTIELDEPYLITGDTPLYIGYTATQKSSGQYPFGMAKGLGSVPRSCYMNIEDTGWTDYSGSYYPLLIEGLVWGDCVPENSVVPSIDASKFINVIGVSLYNPGTNDVSTVDLEYTVDGQTSTVEGMEVGISPFGDEDIEITPEGLSEPGSYPVEVRVTKVNGQANRHADETVEGTIVIGEAAKKMVVCEELTGTGCGYCPRGIVGLSAMKESYPDTFLPIAVHLYNSSDPMYAGSYYNDLWQYFSGAPNCILNRDPELSGDPNESNLETMYAEAIKSQALANISLGYSPLDDEMSKVRLTAKVSPLLEMKDSEYRIAFVVLEDGVDKDSNGNTIYQSNYYSGGMYGTMGGWEKLSSYTAWAFDDVARGIYNYDGLDNSLPSDMEGGEEYTYTYDLEMPYVLNTDNVRFAALLINGSTTEIENAAVAVLGTEDGISSVALGNGVGISATDGGFAVRPENGKGTAQVSLYDVSGKMIWECMSGESVVDVPASKGTYIIRVRQDNSTFDKKVTR